jgi:hypothetical protein
MLSIRKLNNLADSLWLYLLGLGIGAFLGVFFGPIFVAFHASIVCLGLISYALVAKEDKE